MKIKEIEIDGDRIFISKSNIFGYKIVYPYKIDGKWNWKNILTGGSWWNVIILGVLILLILGAISEYTQAVQVANGCLNKIQISPYYFELIK